MSNPRHLKPDYRAIPFKLLTTLSLDKSDISKDLLTSYSFPAVTTFELIPDLSSNSEENSSPWILTALLKFLSLTRIILPLDFWLANANVILEKYGGTQVEVELAVDYQWNWLGASGKDKEKRKGRRRGRGLARRYR